MDKTVFQELLWQHGRELYRSMPWRDNTDPYYILVSELMLQQTQVKRVVPKFETFIERFPTIADLAESPLADVLAQWSGLGYNRRAKYLHAAAKLVTKEYDGHMPNNYDSLLRLPGVGVNTAGAIMAYAYNQPIVFIETNIRTVLFHHFFDAHHDDVTDAALRDIMVEMIDHELPRQWYWATMDYGAYLKKQGVGRIKQSAHYKKQAPLKGSVREVRGQIIRALTKGSMTKQQLYKIINADNRFSSALASLQAEHLVSQTGNQLHLTK